MSYVIDDGFYSNLSQREIVIKLNKAVSVYQKYAVSEYLNILLSEAVNKFDNEFEEGHIFDLYIKLVDQELRLNRETGVLVPNLNLIARVNQHPLDEKTSLITLWGNSDLLNNFISKEKDWIKPYPYWDNTDRPSSVSSVDWETRRLVWDMVIELKETTVFKNSEAIKLGYYKHDTLPDLDVLFTMCDPSSLKFRTDSKRATTLFMTREEQHVKKKGKEFRASDIINLMEEVQAGKHDEAISKVVLPPVSDSKYYKYFHGV